VVVFFVVVFYLVLPFVVVLMVVALEMLVVLVVALVVASLCVGDCNSRGSCDFNASFSPLPYCNCDINYLGVACDYLVCPGDPACSNNGQCTDNGITPVPYCACENLFIGVNCSIPVCEGYPYNVCSGNGYCNVNVNGTPQCICTKTGYGGDNCSEYNNTAECPGNPECYDNGICVNGSCECDEIWEGISCAILKCPLNNGLICNDRGYCVENETLTYCNCSEGWIGESCELVSTEYCPNDCSGFQCHIESDVPFCDCSNGSTEKDCSTNVVSNVNNGIAGYWYLFVAAGVVIIIIGIGTIFLVKQNRKKRKKTKQFFDKLEEKKKNGSLNMSQN